MSRHDILNSMKLTFYGAAQNVTGSKHLVESEGFRLLLDCGLYQGRHEEALERNSSLPFDAKTIDAVILSHAHADHCGMLPVLVQKGFTGKIYATPATIDIAEFILKDSARVQEQDCVYINKHLPEGSKVACPLYTEEDVNRTMPHFQATPYFWHTKQWTRVSETIRFKLYDAGHILGSAVVCVEVQETNKRQTILFTGDLGSKNVPLLRNPDPVEEPIDIMLSECTYGNHLHKPLEEARNDLEHIIKQSIKYKSKIIVPAFSLGRTQELVYILHKLTNEKLIPKIPIYVDSPLAGELSNVYEKHTEELDQNTWTDFGNRSELPLSFPNLAYTKSVEESKRLNDITGPCMIISASGMAEGGRIVHHLRHNIDNPNNIVVFTGYQAEGTLGRKIIQGMSPVYIFGEPHQVKANIVLMNELSAHADQAGLLEYIQSLRGLKNIFLVHTELPQAQRFAELLSSHLPKIRVHIPEPGEHVTF